MHLLTLPYDMRYLIYQHLFPPSKQVYIQALGWRLYVRLPRSQTICPPLLRTCHQLHQEAGEFLYNSYLFNIMGRKGDCLATYDQFVRALTRHATGEVRVDAFSNGAHASTMCISVHTGNGKVAILERRARGVPMPISSIKREVSERATTACMLRMMGHHCHNMFPMLATSVLLAVTAALLAWLFQLGFATKEKASVATASTLSCFAVIA